MELITVFQSIAIISLMIGIGALFSKTITVDTSSRQLLISLIVNIAMPCIILSSIFQVEMTNDLFKMMILIFVLSIVINLVGMGLGWGAAQLFQKKYSNKREIAILASLGNTGFIGIPLCAALLGPEGALYAAMFDAGIDFTIWTVAALFLQKNERFRVSSLKAMINMPVLSIVVGLACSGLHIAPPVILSSLIDKLAVLAAPLAMFYIGILMMTLQKEQMKEARAQVWLPLVMKLIIMPFIVALIVVNFQLPTTMLQTVMIQSMMPTLTVASILFAKYSADESLGAVTTVVSTVLALVTIPLLVLAMNYWLF